MPGSQRENPRVTNSYEHLLEPINYSFASSNPPQTYPLMQSQSPLWNSSLLTPPPNLSSHTNPPPPNHSAHTNPPPNHSAHTNPPPNHSAHTNSPPPNHSVHTNPLPPNHSVHTNSPPPNFQAHTNQPPPNHSAHTNPPPNLQAHRTSPPPNLPHPSMNYANTFSMHPNAQFPISFSDLDNPNSRFIRSSSDLGIRLNHFSSAEESPFSVDNFTTNMEALSASPLYIDENPIYMQGSSISSMQTIPQGYPIEQFLPTNEDHHMNHHSFSTCSQQSDPETHSTSINKFHKLSLGTWVSPLEPLSDNYGNFPVSGNTPPGQLGNVSANSHCQSVQRGSEPSSFVANSKTKRNHGSAKPSYSDVLSKKASQENKGAFNGFQPPYGKQNNIFLDNSGPQKSRADSNHKSTHSKKSKVSGNGNRCNSPNASLNFANVNTCYHTTKENAYSKVGLDRFDIPDNMQNPRHNLSYSSYKNNLNCPSKNCNLDAPDKSNKKSSAAPSSHLSPIHSKRISPAKNEKKNAGAKIDDSSSLSDIDKVGCDQLNNHVPFSQQKQTPKRTSYINNNLSSSNSNISNIKSNNSSSPDVPHSKGGIATYAKEELKTRENGGNDQTKYQPSNLQECDNAPPNSKDSTSRSSGGSSRNVRINSSSKEKAKEALGKRNSKKRKENDSPFNHSELLVAGWNLLLIWFGIAARAGLWLFYLISDVINMSSRLFFQMCLQYLSIGKVHFKRFTAFTSHYCKEVMNFLWPTRGLETNIPLPTTGEQAMNRLFACRGKDPYSILGVAKNCSDDDIKRYYKRQAFLVHPDKNKQVGSEEAFKILAHAFEIIGEPERRFEYDTELVERVNFDGEWGKMATLLAQLKEKIEEAANTIRCTNCNKRHKRVKLPRPTYAARQCADCQIKHAAREGDIWAESCYFGLRWRYYACMEGSIYDISEWAACQRDNLKHLQANTHSVQYRIVSGKKNASTKTSVPECPSEPELEEFFNTLVGDRFNRNDFVPPQTGSSSDTRKRKGKKKK